MKNLKKVLVLLIAVMSSAVSCTKVNEVSQVFVESSQPEESVTEPVFEEQPEESEVIDISGQTITWLADYDLNPAEGENRSAALALFQDIYGAEINFIPVSDSDKFAKLDEMLNSGEKVDMFPYEQGEFPEGAVKNIYQPLDPYFNIMGIDDGSGLWDDMFSAIDLFQYDGQHYVIPYNISNPVVVTYSRKLMEQEELGDPYELYLKGEWDWDAMMSMMRKFVDNHTGITKYGINGYFGQALIQSTGTGVVTCKSGEFTNNIKSPEIEAAGKFMEQLNEMNLIDRSYIGHFPKDNSTLFFVMGSWALGESNALNPESDIMAVPFPKSPDADKYYITCDFDARMLVKNSTMGEAVAAYIKCERIAASQEEYNNARKEQALAVKKSPSGKVKYSLTEEQYNAVQSYLYGDNIAPAFDFGFGMGEKMNNENSHYYSSRGVMNNLTEALINGTVSSWKSLSEEWTGVIDETVKNFNE